MNRSASPIRWSRIAPLGLPVLAAGLMGSHPAPKGSELTVQAGQTLTEYRSISDQPRYRYVSNGLSLHTGGRVRFDNNIVVAAQLGVDHGIVSGFEQVTVSNAMQSESASQHVGDLQWSGGTAMRVGWHDGIIGGDIGVAFANLPEEERHLFPSATGWVGIPRLVYAWGSTFAGPISRARAFNDPMVGLGHRSDRITFWWGTHLEGRLQNLPWQLVPVPSPFGSETISPEAIPWLVGSTVQVAEGVRLGLEYGTGDHQAVQTVPDTRFSLVVHIQGEDTD